MVVAELIRISREISREIGERYEIEVECLGADKDHVHLLCAAHPKMAPGQIARIYKSLTAREVFLALPQLRKRVWGGQFWSDSYYVETVAQRGSWAALGEAGPLSGKLGRSRGSWAALGEAGPLCCSMSSSRGKSLTSRT